MNRTAPDLPQLAVRCPWCNAKAGERCVSSPHAKRPPTYTHAARIKLARAIGPLLTEDIKEVK